MDVSVFAGVESAIRNQLFGPDVAADLSSW
jgi:hypothetical protein